MLPFFAAAVAAVTSPVPSASPSPIPQIVRVVTSDRSAEAISKATRVTYVVTKQQIKENGYRTIGSALTKLPGVEIESYGAIGSNVSFGIRGNNSAQVLVLVDGMPAPGGLAGSVNLGTFSTAGIDRIEVVEGGGSTLYGTGAVGGIINIITDRSTQSNGIARYGSFGDTEFQAGAEGLIIDRTYANNAFGLPSYTSFGTVMPTTRNNSNYGATTLRYSGSKTFGSITAEINLSTADEVIGSPGYYPYVSTTSLQNEVDNIAGLTLHHNGAQSTTTLQLGGTQQQLAYNCNETQEPFECGQPSQSLSFESRVTANLRNAVDAGNQHLVYGIDLSRGTVMANSGGAPVVVPSGAPQPPAVTTAGLAQTAAYVQDNVDFSRSLHAYAGIRGERDGAQGGAISPSVGIEADAGNGVALKVNYATAFRAPNASELYYPGYGNPNLQPERSQVADATLHFTGGAVTASAGWFSTRSNDLIVSTLIECLPPSYLNCIYLPENVAHALQQGFTLEGATRPHGGISASFNATDLYTAENLTSNTRLSNDPVMTVNLGLKFVPARSGIFGGAEIWERVVGQRGSVDYAQPLFFQPAAYSNLTAYVDFRVAPKINLYLRGYNLGNERYADVGSPFGGYPMPGRSFALELQTR
ncbi:MAG TPA: TonB-dependent receptor [Candidatus Tumulicola sp.]|jgi:vitamin B12 transporter